ncbi:helix-turn-helix domain-containing protein [Desulfovibrio sp. OttesenSCG-928-C14]|nr:helix-turn-helix domain-containing protein [Desulfovibrio sp. OttesenSCG-928-C14]
MSEETLTHKDLADFLGVSETTVKSYRRKFPDCIPVASQGKPIRFKAVARDICLRIRDLFALGMSVAEVGERLRQEFGWKMQQDISPTIKGRPSKAAVEAGGLDLSQSFATALGNMAKSMISLNQSQSKINKGLGSIEEMLSDLGLKGFHGQNLENELSRRAKSESTAMDALASALQDFRRLSDNMASLLQKADAMLEENSKLQMALARENAVFLSEIEKIMSQRQAPAYPEGPNAPQREEAGRSPKVLNMSQRRKDAEESDILVLTPMSTPVDSVQIPRQILGLPLVVRLEDGAYISAGGKSMGRVSINDIKAMLAQSYPPPHNFTLRWERDAPGWWVIMEQPGRPADEALSYRFMVQEISSSKGIGVLEIKKYIEGEEQLPVIEFCRFINGIGR